MRYHNFGKRSIEELGTIHDDLVKIFNLALQMSPVDFGISEGYRSPDRQMKLYQEGRTTIDGVRRIGKHNKIPSEAGDIYIYHPDRNIRKDLAYDKQHLCFVAGVMFAAADILLKKREISHGLRWGGNWDGDGILDYDQSFDDLPHFEIIKV